MATVVAVIDFDYKLFKYVRVITYTSIKQSIKKRIHIWFI